MIDKLNFNALAKKRYTEIFKKDVVYDAIIQSGIQLVSNIQDISYDFIDKIFNIDKSSGYLLDLIGKIVGQDRILLEFDENIYFGFQGDPNAGSFGTINDTGVGVEWKSALSPKPTISRKMSDDEYKRILKARILSNSSHGTYNDILSVFNLLANSTNTIIDYPNSGNGTLSIVVHSSDLEFIRYFYNRINTLDNIIPIPLGVNLRINVVSGD